MRDDANDARTTPLTTPLTTLPRRSGPPTGPRSAGLSVVLPPPAAVVLDLDARRARTPAAALTLVLTESRTGSPADGRTDGRALEQGLSIQDRIRLRALEAAARA